MNRRAEGIGNLIAITRARVAADIEALRSLGKSLEGLTLNEYDQMELDEWGRAKDTAQKAQEDSIACLRVLGVLPPFVPNAVGLKALVGVVPRKDVHHRRPSMPGERKRGVAQHKAPGGES